MTLQAPQLAERPRFPLPRYPTGWFLVGWSRDVEPEQAIPLKYFGRDLVMFRTKDGEVSVLDAFCPHLGAHLGHGGKVDGDTIVCPFHAWEFNGKGECTKVPYAKKIPPKATLQTWTVRENAPFIWVWFDIDGREPLWEMPATPEFSSDEWSEPYTKQWRIRTHQQEMAENAVDSAHFKYLHGTQNLPVAEVKLDGPVLHMVTPADMITPKGGVKGQIESISYGFGMGLTRFTGLVDTLLAGCVATIDEEYVDVRFTFTVKKIGSASITTGVGKAFVKEISRQLEQDTPVWENKIHFERPVLCDGDGPIGLYRRWCKQFYPEWYRKQAQAAYYGKPLDDDE